jgi:dipeptidyl aminopeptidase/acylaminoacyl peptidase
MPDPGPARRRITPADLWKVARVGRPVPAPSGGFVIVGVTTYDVEANEGKERLWLLATGSSRPRVSRPLTAPDTKASQPAISPDQRQLAFVRAPAGKDQPQLHLLPLDGGEARCLTDLPLGAADPRWFPDGKRIAFLAPLYRDAPTIEGTRQLAEERKKKGVRPHVTEDRLYRFWDRWLTDGDVHHVMVVDVNSGAVTDLTPDSERWFDLMDPSGQYDVSPTGDEIVFSANISRPPHTVTRWALFAVRTATPGSVRCLTPDNPSDDVRPRYTADGSDVLFGTKRKHWNYADRVRLALVDRDGRNQRILTEGWDRSAAEWEVADADTVVIEAEERGRSCLWRLALRAPASPAGAGAAPAPAPAPAPELIVCDGTLHGPRPAADGYVYLQAQRVDRPPEVARVAIGGGPLETVSRFNDELLAGLELGRSDEIEIQGAGGDRVHVLLLYPPGYEAQSGKRWPLLQCIHGGPYGANLDMWHYRWNQQTFVAPGYVAAFVNFHGSSGYGEAFAESILTDWGGKAAEDIVRATDHLVERGIADPARIAIVGGSFGGYMTCWLATQSDRWACAVAHAAVWDVATLTSADVVQFLEREIGAEPWSLPAHREALERWNPKAHAGAYRTPTLVIHGEKDYRVSAHQALDLYGILKSKGVEARLVYYADENHWILKPQNSIHWYGEFLAWLARHLK